MSRQIICSSKEIRERGTAVFTFRDEVGMLCDAFVIWFEGTLYAYRNQCRHQPLSLDYGDGYFFDEDRELLLCRNHGALFRPDSGLCVTGPCCGAHLHRLNVEEQDGNVIFTGPEESELPDLE